MNPNPADLPPLENLLVAALYLATHYAKSGCPRLSQLLLHQLEFVMNHPRGGVAPMVQETSEKLHDAWKRIHAERVSALLAAEAPSVTRRAH